MPHALLVDDDLGFVLGLAEAVRHEGFSVSTAATVKPGVRIKPRSAYGTSPRRSSTPSSSTTSTSFRL